MNIKFRMPKLSAEQMANQEGTAKRRSIVKELLLTVIATTISIVLTFGTAALLDKKAAEKARRLMAMTIISDIDQSLDVVRKRLELEEKSHGIACYVIENQNRLDRIGLDTLDLFINYVTSASFNSELEFKTMNENIFNSSQDSWRTLNDRKFLNNVQEFYNARAVLEQQHKDWIFFQKPVTPEEEYEMFMGGQCASTVDLCRWLLDCKRLKSYLDFVSLRINAYSNFLQLNNLNEENKFLMNITEQQMKEFVNQTYMEIRPAKEKNLTGTWNAVLPDNKSTLAYEFRKDHTFTLHQSIRWGHHMFRDKMVQRYSLSGTWAVQADSLVLRYDMQSYQMEVDDSQISYPPHLAADVRALKQELEAIKPLLVRRLDLNPRTAHATNLDRSGTRLELTEANNPPVHYQRVTSS